MTIRFSTGLRSFAAYKGSYKRALNGGKIKIYSGAQPASADDAPTGTLLCVISDNSGTVTNEVRASGTVTLSGGASGSINTVSVNSINILDAAVPFNTDLNTTAADLAEAINESSKNALYIATASGSVVTLTAIPGLGAVPNTWVVSATLTTITATYGNMSGGVGSVNGLALTEAGGVLTKKSGQTWSGVALATGTAGWFRYEGPVADSGAADASAAYSRVDGAIGTSGSDMNLSSVSLVIGAAQTLTSASITLPAA